MVVSLVFVTLTFPFISFRNTQHENPYSIFFIRNDIYIFFKYSLLSYTTWNVIDVALDAFVHLSVPLYSVRLASFYDERRRVLINYSSVYFF